MKRTGQKQKYRIKQRAIDWLSFCGVSTNNRTIICLLFRRQVLAVTIKIFTMLSGDKKVTFVLTVGIVLRVV